jgi:hypothetical protein
MRTCRARPRHHLLLLNCRGLARACAGLSTELPLALAVWTQAHVRFPDSLRTRERVRSRSPAGSLRPHTERPVAHTRSVQARPARRRRDSQFDDEGLARRSKSCSGAGARPLVCGLVVTDQPPGRAAGLICFRDPARTAGQLGKQ